MTKKNLRSEDTVLALLGTSVDHEAHLNFNCNRTPTNREVLLSFLATKALVRENSNKTTKIGFEVKCRLFEKLMQQNAKAGFPTQSRGGVFSKIDVLFQKYEKERKKYFKKKLVGDSFKNFLNQSFITWPKNTKQVLVAKLNKKGFMSVSERQAIEEDIAFVESMETTRIASYGPVDIVSHTRERNKLKRSNSSRQQLPTVSSSKEIAETIVIQAGTSSYVDQDYEPPPPTSKPKRKKDSTVNLSLPVDVLSNEEVVKAAARCNVTPSQNLRLFRAYCKAGGTEPGSFYGSHSYIQKKRDQVLQSSSQSLSESWCAPDECVLHFDGKAMKEIKTARCEERLAVCISGNFGSKILGIPPLGKNLRGQYGSKVCQVVETLIQKWNVKEAIYAVVFDTTAANTGRLTGAVATLQRKLNRFILKLPCRHHVLETVARRVFDKSGVEPSKSPESRMFNNFQKRWDELVVNEESEFTLPIAGQHPALVQKLKEMCESRTSRDDYKEVQDLALFYLTGENPPTFRRPGATSQARWMSKIIYTLKLVILSREIRKQLPRDCIIIEDQLSILIRLANFFAIVYVKWWISCTKAAESPRRDLEMVRDTILFKETDDEIASTALDALQNHQWYLDQTLVPMSLFDPCVSDQTKKSVCEKMLRYSKDVVFSASSSLSKRSDKLTGKETLENLVGPKSWEFFSSIGSPASFMEKPVESWDSDLSFWRCKVLIENTQVVNDVAERAVQLGSKVIKTVRSEESFQAKVQVIQQDQKDIPDLRKST